MLQHAGNSGLSHSYSKILQSLVTFSLTVLTASPVCGLINSDIPAKGASDGSREEHPMPSRLVLLEPLAAVSCEAIQGLLGQFVLKAMK